MSIQGFCPNCQKETEIALIQKEEEFNVRGELIRTPVQYDRCTACGADFERGNQGYDPLENVYQEYRKRKGLLQPQEMKTFRKSLNLTQKEMSRIWGIGVATLNRYENGALQSEAHDQMLRLLMVPANMEKLILDKSRHLPQEIRAKIGSPDDGKTGQESDACADLLDAALQRYGSYRPDIYSGFRSFEVNKFFQMIKFFCYGFAVVKTKLMKLCFYADFKHFKDYGISITGCRYAHATHGPVPHQFETWLAAMVEWNGNIQVEENIFGGYAGEDYSSRDADLSVFSVSEIKVLNQVKDYFKSFTACGIRDFSHREKGYTATENGARISYDYAQDLQI